jgi:peptide deformylase
MSLLPIYTFDHPVLRKETEQLTVDNAELQKLIDDMFETMYNANGIGLAANQIGKSLALTVIDISEFDEFKHIKPLVLINPVITGFHGESVHEEGCLSVPGIREEIVRPSEIGLEFYDRNFKEVEMETDKILARVMQHEIDHLHGKYFFDYLNAFKLSFLKNKLNKMKKGEVEADYPLAPPSSAKVKKGKLTRM